MKRTAVILLITALTAPGAASAQMQHGRLPSDSMEIGRKFMQFVLDREADSLYAYMTPAAQERLGSPEQIAQQMSQFDQLGEFIETVEEKWVLRNGQHQFWHYSNYSQFPEQFLMRFVITTDGLIDGAGAGPASQAPPTDSDPDQV